MTNAIRFRVYGDPAPKGSMKAFMPRGARRPIVTHDNAKTKPWQMVVHFSAREFTKEPFLGPVMVTLNFRVKRPQMSKRKAAETRYSAKKPDLDKLVRCCLDAFKGILYLDDGQVSMLSASKHYVTDDEPAGVIVQVEQLIG